MIGNPLGLIALLSIPAILGIHWFRRRFKPRPVAGLFLWPVPRNDPSSGRRLHRLERSWSLFFELLAATLLSLYIADIRFDSEQISPHVVIVLDGSASMSAVDGKESIAERAREEARAVIDAAGRGARVDLIVSGPSPILLAGPGAPAIEALESLERFKPSARSHRFHDAFDLARELVGADRTFHVVTDHAPRAGEVVPPTAHWHAVGKSLRNAGLLTVRRETSDDGKHSAFVRVGAFSSSPLRALLTIKLEGTGAIVSSDVYSFETEREISRTYPIPAEGVTIELSDDALLADNVAILPSRPRRDVTWLNLLPEGSTRTSVGSVLFALTRVAPAADVSSAHVVFAPADIEPSGRPSAWWFRFGLPPATAATSRPSGAVKSFVGPFLMDKGHLLLQDLDLGGVVIGGVLPTEDAITPIINAQGRAILGISRVGGDEDVFLNADLDASTLVRSSDWPVLLANFIDARRQALPGSESTEVEIGGRIVVNLPEVSHARLISPSGNERPLGGRRAVAIENLEERGTWSIVDGEKTLHAFAVNMHDPRVSDLEDRATKDIAPSGGEKLAETESQALISPIFHTIIIACGLLLIVLDLLATRAVAAARRAA